MNISFQGIKNVRANTYERKQTKIAYTSEGNTEIYPRLKITEVQMELTNENEKDLDYFEKFLERFPNESFPKSLAIQLVREFDDINHKKKTLLVVNGYKFMLNEETLHLFIRLNKLLNIAQSGNKELMKLEDEYLNSYPSIDGFQLDQIVPDSVVADEKTKKRLYENVLFGLHKTEWVQECSTVINEKIKTALTRYLRMY